ncbi:MAG TPA: hypothetical protein VII34_01665 [Pyrinomonadaceae bacterium]
MADRPRDFEWLFRTWRELQSTQGDVEFDFAKCGFIGQNAVAFIGGAARLMESRGWAVRFLTGGMPLRVKVNLQQNGFLHAFGQGRRGWLGNSIPFRQDSQEDPRGFVQYLEKQWLGRGWVDVSAALREAIVSRVGEAYTNVFQHSKSPVGLCSCGQYFPKLHQLKLTLVDFGVGIPSNVRLFLQRTKNLKPEQLSAEKCMEWAFQPGTSTLPGGRGLGLDLLTSFVKLNAGEMRIFSHEGHATVTTEGVVFSPSSEYFEGTLVNILLHCDERYYYLTSEQP